MYPLRMDNIMLTSTELRIKLPSASYSLYIAPDLFDKPEVLQQQVLSKQALIVSNETVAPLYLDQVRQALSHIQCDTLVLPDGEAYKSQQSLFCIYDALLRHHHHRDTTLFALGGGVIGDMTGFAASTYQRGVRLVQLPTTLLSQVDSSVGGKTAINLPQGKNMVGSFYQPHAVIMDLSTLKTLPERELSAGFAEVIKYGMLVGGDFWQQLSSHIQLIQAKHRTSQFTDEAWRALSYLITQCCCIKADIVREDEREHGRRALLNLGHTFAHALEAITNYERWLHGEAVAIGLYYASVLSHRLGYLKTSDVDKVKNLLHQAGLPYLIPQDIDLDCLQTLMWQDKKVQDNKLPFIVIRRFGDCVLERGVTNEQIKSLLREVSAAF